MKVIANIPEDMLQELKDGCFGAKYTVYDLAGAICDGVVLPDLVNKLPSVTPQDLRWIPVTERLPEEMFGCLVTVWDANPKTGEEFENILPEFVGYDGETWNGADGKPIAFEVVAWMPLPEPYKEDKE